MEKVKSWTDHLPPPARFLRITFVEWFPPKSFSTGIMFGLVCMHLFQIAAGLGRLPDWSLLKDALSDTAFFGVCWLAGCGGGVCSAAYSEFLSEQVK